MAQGFTADMLAGLIHDGLATAAPETVMVGGRAIEVTRVKITEAGRRALGYTIERRHIRQKPTERPFGPGTWRRGWR
jgi:hypothetical protein